MLNKLKSQFGTSLKRLLAAPGTAPPEAAADRSSAVTTRRLPADPASRARHQKRRQLRLMQRHLHALMEQHADSRRLMRHLALVEHTLRKEGVTAVEALPRPVIDKALIQLESLVQDWSPEGLAEVRSRMAVMLRDRAPAGALGDATTDADDEISPLDGGLIVTVDMEHLSETDHAAFAEMERSWAGRMPAELGRAQAAAEGGREGR